jgi:hypothetical protein
VEYELKVSTNVGAGATQRGEAQHSPRWQTVPWRERLGPNGGNQLSCNLFHSRTPLGCLSIGENGGILIDLGGGDVVPNGQDDVALLD